jgi:hypothetical protein
MAVAPTTPTGEARRCNAAEKAAALRHIIIRFMLSWLLSSGVVVGFNGFKKLFVIIYCFIITRSVCPITHNVQSIRQTVVSPIFVIKMTSFSVMRLIQVTE